MKDHETTDRRTISRRGMLTAMASFAVVTGYDPLAGSWLSEAQAAPCHPIPHLDGELLVDGASVSPFGEDLGNMVQHRPYAVLFPGSVEDIQKMIRFAGRHGLHVAARGQGHATFGQAQARGGIIINMSSLNTIHSIRAHSARVDAGVTWKSLVTSSVAQGLTPPGLTGFTNLSVGGTLSVGGVTPFFNRGGAQVDNVRALEVVTGTGALVYCSERRNRDLFEAALGGLGQCGIIVRAVVDLVPAPTMSRTYLINYSDNSTFFADLRTLLEREELDGMYNLWVPNDSGGYTYQLNAVKHFDVGESPDDAFLVRGLCYDAMTTTDATYLDTMLRVDGQIEYLRSLGLFDAMHHPWFDVFLPDETVEGYVGDVLSTLTPEDVGPFGFMLLLVLKRSELRRPFFRVPDDTDYVYLFDVLTSSATPTPDADYDSRMLARNRSWYEMACSQGGTRYPIGSLELSKHDWREHYGRTYRRFAHLKRRFDPRQILTPGPGIF